MRPSAAHTLRVTRLSLENWKNFQAVDVALEGRAFLIGPNASGKSNFLDVFRFLRDLVGVGGGFQEAVLRRGGLSGIRCLAARPGSEVAIAVEIGTTTEPARWRYEMRFGQSGKGAAHVVQERVFHGGHPLLARPLPEDAADPQRQTQTHLEQVNANREFREIAELFSSIRYLHLVPQLVREPERSNGRSNDPFGGDLLEQMLRTPARTLDSRLSKISAALRTAVPQLRELALVRDPQRGTPHLRCRFEHWRLDDSWQTEEQISDGTLRLFGLLWAALDGRGPLLLEEPELSLYSEVVRQLPQLLVRLQRQTGRQILLSSHSADLLRDEGIGLDEVLLLRPGREGTQVIPATGLHQAKVLVEAGVEDLGEIVLPLTRPSQVSQLALPDPF